MTQPSVPVNLTPEEEKIVAELQANGFTVMKQTNGRSSKLILSRSKGGRFIISPVRLSPDVKGRDR